MTTKIIMDTDPGIDDAAALTMAINDPSIDLKLVTAVAGNVTVDKTTANALKIIHFFGKDIPVAAGAEQPLIKPFEDAARIHGESGMPGYDFGNDYGQPIKKTAVEALHDAIMAEDEVTLVPTGSYTNIALLFSEYPEVKSHIKRIVAMGGSMSGGNMTSVAEFNVFTDPDAARIMYNSGIPIVMVGLDVTLKALLTKDTIEKLGQMNKTGETMTVRTKGGRCTMLTPSSTCSTQKRLPLRRCGLTFRRKVQQLVPRLATCGQLTTTARRTLKSA